MKNNNEIKLMEGAITLEKQSITIYDVAKKAGVSMATVSRVVNGNPNVKPGTRKKVLDVIDELDYRPNAVARGLASKKTTNAIIFSLCFFIYIPPILRCTYYNITFNI